MILNDFGGAFAMGAVGGTIWHGIKGARNSPRVSRLSLRPSAVVASPNGDIDGIRLEFAGR